MSEKLTTDQKNFLNECAMEFSERFTDADVEYKEVYDNGIPPPPIMYPWSSRGGDRRNRGGRGGYGRFNNRYDIRHQDNRYNDRNRDYRGYGDRQNNYYNDYRR